MDKATPIFGRKTNNGRDTEEDFQRRKEALRRQFEKAEGEDPLPYLRKIVAQNEVTSLRLSAMEKLLFSVQLEVEALRNNASGEEEPEQPPS